jgi:hypothetical protein
VRDSVAIADDVLDIVVKVVGLEGDIKTEVYGKIDSKDVGFDQDLEDDTRELDNESELEEAFVIVDGEEEELGAIEYKFNLNPAPQSSNGVPAHLIIRLVPYFSNAKTQILRT